MYDWYIVLSSGPGRQDLVTDYGAMHVLYHCLQPWFNNILREDFNFEVFTSIKRLMDHIEVMEGTRLVFVNFFNV